MYTFLDVIAIADGSYVARIADASRYPRHTLYTHGDKRGSIDFERGDGWEPNQGLGSSVLPPELKEIAPTVKWFSDIGSGNRRFDVWGAESFIYGWTPFRTPRLLYTYLRTAGMGNHPIVHHGEDGTKLTVDDLKKQNVLIPRDSW